MSLFRHLLISFLSIGLVASSAMASVKVGAVDLQRAIQATSAGKKAKQELETEFNRRKQELEKKEADLKTKGEEIERRRAVWSEEQLAQRQAEFQQEMLRYREQVGQSQMEIQRKERELTEPILQRMQRVINEIAQKEGYTVVLERGEQGVLFIKPDADLTDKVIAAFEKKD